MRRRLDSPLSPPGEIDAANRGHFSLRASLDSRQATCVLFLILTLTGVALPAIGESLSDETNSVSSQVASCSIEDLHLGLEGKYKLGFWTPIRVALEPSQEIDSAVVEVELLDPNGVPSIYSCPATGLVAGQPSQATCFVKFGRSHSRLRVTVRTGDTVLGEREFGDDDLPDPIPTGQQFTLTIGDSLDVEQALTALSGSRLERMEHGHASTLETLPDHWLGYAAVDAIVLSTADAEVSASLSTNQWSAIRTWVEQGGRLVLCGATQLESLVTAHPQLASLVPGELQGTVVQRQLTSMEQFASASSRVDQGGDSIGMTLRVPMARLGNIRGVVEVVEGIGATRHPAIVRSTYGLGLIVFVAFDLNLPPFQTWQDRPQLMMQILAQVLAEPEEDEAIRSRVGPVAGVGYTDLIGQLSNALDQFPQVRLIPFSWIATLIAIYILIVGPLDYYLVRRWRRPELTWVTFPLTVLLCVGLAATLAIRSKGTELRINQVNLVDVDAKSGVIRGRSWSHLFTPQTAQVDLHTEPSHAWNFQKGPHQITSWQGLPGSGFSGLDRDDHQISFSKPYSIRMSFSSSEVTDVRLADFPIAVWSSRSLLGQWWGQLTTSTKPAPLIRQASGVLSGTVVNTSPFDLEDVYLVYNERAYKLGDLPSGGTIRVDQADGTNLQTMLTRRQVVKGRNVVTPWSQSDTDVDRIMELLMYYESAKGNAYTRLRHRFQSEIDWSDHVMTNQAVLWGRSTASFAELKVNDTSVPLTQQWNYCRVLLPVREPEE